MWVGGAGSLVGNPGAGGVVNTYIHEREVSEGAQAELSLHSHGFERPECQEETLCGERTSDPFTST